MKFPKIPFASSLLTAGSCCRICRSARSLGVNSILDSRATLVHSQVRLLSMAAPPRKLDGKVAVVTASTEGIGFAIAKDLGRHGAKVYISSRKEDKVLKAIDELSKEIDVAGVVCHVGKPDDRQKLIDKVVNECGQIDVLVSNAAANPIFGPMLEVDETSWDKIFDINVKSAFFLAKECVPHMSEKGGSIMFISSIAGFQPMQPIVVAALSHLLRHRTTETVISYAHDSTGAYSVSKTALFGLTKAFANELAAMNIRVNCIAPGIIKTGFSSAIWKNEGIKEHMMNFIPQKRIGEPDEIGTVASFLASDESKYMTGEVINVTGGMSARL